MAGVIIRDNIVGKWTTLPTTTVDLHGRIVVITGANSGLGFEAAKMFYAMNPARLIITAREMGKGEAAKLEILKVPKDEGAP
jgi:retinol dehydrogenase 12